MAKPVTRIKKLRINIFCSNGTEGLVMPAQISLQCLKKIDCPSKKNFIIVRTSIEAPVTIQDFGLVTKVISNSEKFSILERIITPCRRLSLMANTPLRGQNTWAKMRAKRDSPCVFVPANAVSDYSGLLATRCPVCYLKLTGVQRKNHATALCVVSLTNTFTQLICQNCRLRNHTSKP